MKYPHCDSRILHAPGECEYCDLYPVAQELRVRDWVAFTGHAPVGFQTPCPADIARGPDSYNQWGGNRAKAPGAKVLGHDWADYEITGPKAGYAGYPEPEPLGFFAFLWSLVKGRRP